MNFMLNKIKFLYVLLDNFLRGPQLKKCVFSNILAEGIEKNSGHSASWKAGTLIGILKGRDGILDTIQCQIHGWHQANLLHLQAILQGQCQIKEI